MSQRPGMRARPPATPWGTILLSAVLVYGCTDGASVVGGPADSAVNDLGGIDSGFDSGIDAGIDTGFDAGTDGPRCGPAQIACNGMCVSSAVDPGNCGACAEQWRCGASCACANLAETGTTHLPGGTQCWYEQATARIADGAGHRLLEERDPTFLSWTYGRVAAAARSAGQNPSRVERKVRLPLAT